MPEAVFTRSTHRLSFAFFAPSRELMGEDTNTVSREEREATKCVVPSGAELEHRKVRSPGFGYC
ncbi:protein of unknown function [Methanoculleus bourgensis]|uniref:Uncharacterized protein n=1 Tax=Methanoculleus bourgensis TaxID=83986 RepID=A0A0X3BKV4_9EURY|nr:protein of unknown function [Methanoculleus bourgensis]